MYHFTNRYTSIVDHMELICKILGNACRNKVLNTLRKKFKSPKEAEKYYFPQKVEAREVLPTVVDSEVSVGEICAVPNLLPSMSNLGQLDMISELFKSYCTLRSDVSPPDDFLQLSMLAMKHLRLCGRSNVLYHLAKALGTMRNNQNESLLPARRMPMGLIEHCVNFFCSTSIRQVNDCCMTIVGMNV